ncbi:TfoX/Sxy family protein [Cupriavidus gilardii]|uniref:TfoX/Sxy family protein n=1 Tax=Cupriavidus gilardii TaxID=82541 RepID=UPI0021B1A77B|nr:TfoX/Sxy family protein [Cupriavidus gilardii]UXC38588.1 TfoX/Sxy family protein [Cupriavidus gilardii]
MSASPRRPDPFVDHLLELMAPLAARIGPIAAKRMFGGHGLYYDGLMFGLVSDGRCYLKADALTLPRFEAQGCEPFSYRSRDKEVVIRHYLSLPAQCLESAGEMEPWARAAVEATLRLANGAPARRKPAARKAAPKEAAPEQAAPSAVAPTKMAAKKGTAKKVAANKDAVQPEPRRKARGKAQG